MECGGCGSDESSVCCAPVAMAMRQLELGSLRIDSAVQWTRLSVIEFEVGQLTYWRRVNV